MSQIISTVNDYISTCLTSGQLSDDEQRAVKNCCKMLTAANASLQQVIWGHS